MKHERPRGAGTRQSAPPTSAARQPSRPLRRRALQVRNRSLMLLGYCGVCGADVETDFCYECGRYVQPHETDD